MEIAQKSQIHIKMVFPSSVCLSVSPMLVALSIYMSICVSIWVCPSVGLTVCSTIQLLENFENQWNKLTEIWPVTNQKPQIMPSQFKDLYIFSIVTISLFEFFSIAKMILNLFVVSVYVLVFFMPFPLPQFITRKKEAGPFGIPRKWATNRLPTRAEVGAHYYYKRMEMEANHGPVPTKRDVAAKVTVILRDFEMN